MKKLIIPATLIVLLCGACNKHFYAPALYNDDISYQPKPASFDSAKSATYISIGEGFNQAVNINTTVSFGEFDLSRGHVIGNTNLSYGAFGFLGSIDNSNHQNELKDPHSFESKSFAGIGGRASFNMFKVLEENINFRYIGVEATYSKEYGDFAAYRREIQNLPDYAATSRTEMFTLGATSEILWHSPKSTANQFAFRFFLGKTFGNYDYLKNTSTAIYVNNIPLYFTASYFMQIKHFWGAAELTRNDISIPGIRIKVGYRF